MFASAMKLNLNISPALATLCAVATATCLAAVKLIVGFLTGSAAIIASGVDSMLDVGISLFNYIVLKKSRTRANRRFHYGYGKLESLAAALEGGIIAASGLFVLCISVVKIYENAPINALDEGLFVMLLSTFVTLGLVAFLSAVNRRAKSELLSADILHYKTDLLSNSAILATLFIVWLTGFTLLDGILGIIISLYIMYQAVGLMRESVALLLDRAISDEKQQQIEAILAAAPITSYHALRTRRVGRVIYVNVHLVFDELISLKAAHAITHGIESAIRAIDGDFLWDIVTHLDPEDDSEFECHLTDWTR